MPPKTSLTVQTYSGDSKTLLAFDFGNKADAKNLAGFTIQCQPPGGAAYYLFNQLQFQDPTKHAQVATEPPKSSINAPIHKFRWIHVTGSVHQGVNPAVGQYTYTVTPRYFDGNQSMLPLDSSMSVSVKTNVGPFQKKNLSLGFTRGYVQSEAFVHHFGPKANMLPPSKNTLIFDTSQQAGQDPAGKKYTYADEYSWLGSSARIICFNVLNEVLANKSLRLDVFAYDLDEPDLCKILLQLAGQGRIRVILDNASLHHNSTGKLPEDQFEAQFNKAAKSGAQILRGKFGRFSHDKVFIVSTKDSTNPANATKVLTGSTNFSLTGLYVNANHVLLFDDPAVAKQYSAVFNEAWADKVSVSFRNTALATTPFQIQNGKTPQTTITFSPHTAADVQKILGGISTRIQQETARGVAKPSVIFAVMELTGSPSPVYSTLTKLHASQNIFTYGISDDPGGVTLYATGKSTGVLVTGKTGQVSLPPPFDQLPLPPGHEIHDKFVVCGFNGKNPVVYCGSSNLATGGEADNGDNLLAIQDADVATCFAIEGLLLVDHYSFLDRYVAPKSSAKATAPKLKKQPQSPAQAAVEAAMFLSTTDAWTKPYFDPNDLHCVERNLFS